MPPSWLSHVATLFRETGCGAGCGSLHSRQTCNKLAMRPSAGCQTSALPHGAPLNCVQWALSKSEPGPKEVAIAGITYISIFGAYFLGRHNSINLNRLDTVNLLDAPKQSTRTGVNRQDLLLGSF